jgi:hypothetical protein
MPTCLLLVATVVEQTCTSSFGNIKDLQMVLSIQADAGMKLLIIFVRLRVLKLCAIQVQMGNLELGCSGGCK